MQGRSLRDVLPLIVEGKGKVTYLMRIKLKECRGLECTTGTHQGSSLLCPQLEKLHLDKLLDLRNITKLMALDSFTHLQSLFICRCPKIKVIFPFTKQLHLPNLETIIVEECEEVEEMFESDKCTLCQSLSHAIPCLPNLRYLRLRNLPKMEVIFPFTKQLHLPKLETLIVEECKEVKEMFESHKSTLCQSLSYTIPSFLNLGYLRLKYLPKVKGIFPFTKEFHLPNLETIRVEGYEQELYLFDLPKLGTIYRGLLHCTSLHDSRPYYTRCPKLNVLRLPKGLIIHEESWSTMELIISNAELRETLQHDFPEYAFFSYYANQQPPPPALPDSDDEFEWGPSLSLSLLP
ncbi:Disease resistance protein RPS2 [Bienertia sinuspersici]